MTRNDKPIPRLARADNPFMPPRPGSRTIAATLGNQKANIGGECRSVAAMAEVDTVSPTDDGCAPGVSDDDAKLQEAPAGRLEQDSETGSEAPVWVKASMNCAAWPR